MCNHVWRYQNAKFDRLRVDDFDDDMWIHIFGVIGDMCRDLSQFMWKIRCNDFTHVCITVRLYYKIGHLIISEVCVSVCLGYSVLRTAIWRFT